MTAKNIIEQIEKMFGRQPEQYMFQLINDDWMILHHIKEIIQYQQLLL